MADKQTRPKKPARSGRSQQSVLGSLPATRPTRLGRRAGAATDGEDAAAATTAAKPRSRSTAKPKAKPKAASKPKPKAASKPKATAASKPKAAAKPKAAPTPPRRPTPPPPPEEPRRRSGPPAGGEIVTTAVQAVGELAQIGLGAGARALRRAARRIQS